MIMNWRIFVTAGLALVLLLAVHFAQAAAVIYGINNNASAIIRIDANTSASTVVYTGTPFPLGTRSAAMAQCGNGLLYFVQGGANGRVYSFNPFTPAVAPILLGNTGAGIPDMIRLSCQPGTNVLYGMGTSPATIYTINRTTGVATAIALTLPGITPPASGSGDIAFNPAGVLFYVGETTNGNAATERLWTINLATNTIVNVGAVTGLTAVVNGIEFEPGGNIRLSVTGGTQLFSVAPTGGAVTAIGGAGSMPAVFDLAGFDALANPDLSITKTDGRNFVSAGDSVTYTIVVTNNSAYAVTGTVTDTVPASISSVTWTCAAGAGSTCGAASGTGNSINTTATLAASGGTATYTVTGTLSGAATGTLTNTAAVALPFAFMADATPANNSAIDNTTISQNPTISKAFSPASIPVNGISTLTFTLSNPNATALTGIDFTDTYPVGVVNATPLTVGGTCAGVTHTAVAGGNTFNVTGGTIPGGVPGTCTITVRVTSGALGTYNNTTSGVLSAQTTTRGAASNTAALQVVAGGVSVVKSVLTICDPFNFNVNPKAIPGAFVRYEVRIQNSTAISATLTSIGDVLDLNHNFDADLRSGSAAACATSPPESALGRGFKLTCAGGTRACNTPVFFTSTADTDAMGIAGANITITFGDGPAGAKALPTEAGYAPGELKPGESVTVRFNAIVR